MGDQMVNWGKNDGIKSVMNMTLSSAFSGIALNHSDIGGYTTVTLPIIKAVRKPQLLNRWSELNVFSPVFRTHEGVKPDKNIQVYSNPEEVIKFAFYGKLHFQLKPYLKTLVKEAHETGIAPARPMFLEFPNDEICKDLYSQMMLGSEILFAPVLKKNAKKVKVYLPKGEWIHYFSKQTYKGEKYYKVAAPVGQPAFFIKSGSPVLEVLKMD
jgi:alpha-glucosidase